jgi:hypothetical protein
MDVDSRLTTAFGNYSSLTLAKQESSVTNDRKGCSGAKLGFTLADGMTEELIGRLANIHGMRVISRTSAMHFKNT